jgi:hypothetical protein
MIILRRTEAGVPQGIFLRPVLHLIYTRDLTISDNTTITTFPDDTAFLATREDTAIESIKLKEPSNIDD